METVSNTNDNLIKKFCFGIGLALLAASMAAMPFSGGFKGLLYGWREILISPCPLITDYFGIGGVAGTFFNGAVCSLTCMLVTVLCRARTTPSFLAAYMLLVAHCFYGMNFLNIWPCYIGVIIYYHYKKKDFREYLHIAMFSMAFGPLVSEMLFRYTLEDMYIQGEVHVTLTGIVLTILVGLAAGIALPGMLEGALWMHKGYNLYNGGLAFGLVGGFLYALLYKTLGRDSGGTIELNNPFYDGIGESTWTFANVFFIFLFGAALITGYILNKKSFNGYKSLTEETGHLSSFAEKYGMPLCLINFGIYGFMVLGYMNLIMLFTEGVAFTGPTVGAIFAAMTFAAAGQHPKNTWSIFGGYVLLSVFVTLLYTLRGEPVPWTLTTQGYINGVAFATGLAPMAGKYGWKVGLTAGIIGASICTSTAAVHGGFMLFNGGFSAGITALILVPILEHHFPHMRVKNK